MFRNLLTEEQRHRLAQRNEMYAEQRTRFRAMTNSNLTASAKYYMTQMPEPRWKPGAPVYDAVLWYVILPELLRRLEDL